LHVDYGNALIAARGYSAPETTEAFARVRELASGDKDAPARLAADYGLWGGSFVRGELPAIKAHAAAFLRDVAASPDSPEAGVAHRILGSTHWFAGEYREARSHLEQALALFKLGRDDDLALRFGHDVGVAAMFYFGLVLWPLGDVERAISHVGSAEARTAGLTYIGARAFGAMFAALFALMRGDVSGVASNAAELARLTREHDLPMWRAFGVFLEGLALAESGALNGGLEDMRRGIEFLRQQNVLQWDGLLKIALAEAEARAGVADRAVAVLDEALATCERTGHRAFEAELHRVRGEMLLKRDPANAAIAEEALQTAIAVAKKQGTRSFELRASLALAKLYQSTGRPVDAHTVIAPALEGFAPTPEMSEIAEAEALLAALAASEPVAAELRRRETRSKLHAGYALATMMTKGFGAEETRAALARAASAPATEMTPEYWTVAYGRINADMMGGDMRSARAGAEAFLAEAEAAGLPGHAAFARRMLGFLKLLAGDFAGARVDLERALADHDERRDESLRTVFALDFRSNALAYLGLVAWHLGDFQEAERLTNEAIRRAKDSGQPGSYATALANRLMFFAARGQAEEVLRAAEEMRAPAEAHDLKFWRAIASTYADWARVRLGEKRAEAFRAGLRAYADLGAGFQGMVLHLLVEVELVAGNREDALGALDRGLALAAEEGVGLTRPWLLRLRGDALAETDPAGAASAYREALSVAGAQGSRALALLAALALAKLLKSTSEAEEAHAVLSDALEGFAPTPLFPAIAEAQALIAALAETGEVKAAVARRERRVKLQNCVRPSAHVDDGCLGGGQGRFRSRPRNERRVGRRRRAILRFLCAVCTKLHAGRMAPGASDGRDLPARSRGRRIRHGSVRRPPLSRRSLSLSGRPQGGANPPGRGPRRLCARSRCADEILVCLGYGGHGSRLSRVGDVAPGRSPARPPIGRTGDPARGRVGSRPDQRVHVWSWSASRRRTRRSRRRASLGGNGASAWSRTRNGLLCCPGRSLRWLGARSTS
jgi:predicted ATPase